MQQRYVIGAEVELERYGIGIRRCFKGNKYSIGELKRERDYEFYLEIKRSFFTFIYILRYFIL